jgi:hypothetical protein
MITTAEIIEKGLKDGREYLYIGGERYRQGDCFLTGNGREVTVKTILDPAHFFDERSHCRHTHMFHDQKCEHCFERNADKKTKDRTPAAMVADIAEKAIKTFRENMLKNEIWQVYDSYDRIHFYQRMCGYLIECGHEPSTMLSDELLKHGDNLLSDMYGYYLYNPHATVDVGTKNGRDQFITRFAANRQNQAY